MVTAMDNPLIAEDALKTGVYDYILKPFDPNGVIISVATPCAVGSWSSTTRPIARSFKK